MEKTVLEPPPRTRSSTADSLGRPLHEAGEKGRLFSPKVLLSSFLGMFALQILVSLCHTFSWFSQEFLPFLEGSVLVGWAVLLFVIVRQALGWNRSHRRVTGEALQCRQDLAELKLREADLRLKEEIYRIAVAQVDSIPYQVDYLNNRYEYIDPGVEKLTGYRPDELTPKFWKEHVLREILSSRETTENGRRMSVSDRLPEGELRYWTYDYRIRMKDGSPRWCTDAFVQVLDEKGRPIGSVGILQDITEKIRVEEELRNRIQIEQMVTRISTEFIQESHASIDSKIRESLRSIGEFTGSDRCFLFEFRKGEPSARKTHEWIGGDPENPKEGFFEIRAEDYPGLVRELRSGQTVRNGLSSGERRSLSLQEERRMLQQGLGSFLMVPQRLGGETVGFVGVAVAETGRVWPETTLSLLRVVGQILAYAQGRRQNEQAIIASKERYRRLFEDSHDAIYMMTEEGHLVDVNPAFLDLFGYAREEIESLDGFSLFASSEERLRFQSEIEREGALRDYEVTFKKKSGIPMEVLLTASIRKDSQGRILGHQGIIRDITEKKKADKSLRLIVEGTSGTTGEAFFSSLVRALAGVLGTRYALVTRIVQSPTKEGKKVVSLAFWSGKDFGPEVAIDLSGTPCEEAAQKGLLYLPSGAMDRYPESNLMRELGIQCYMGIRLTDSSGHPIGVLSVFDERGLSIEPRTAENLLRIFAARASAELSRIEAENTRLELERQMFESQKIESLGVLAGGIAHDFNNLLTSILGNVCLAEYDLEEDSPLQGYLKNIEIATQRAADLAHQMLAYSGKSKFVIESLQINDLLEEVEDLLSAALPKNVAFEKDLAYGLPPLDGDATQLRQVFMNLIINAGEAIPSMGGLVKITTRQVQLLDSYPRELLNRDELPPGLYVEIRIADTGVGMDDETKSKIFDPFFTTKFTGRGLGLAAVLGIVRGHGGGIGVESTLGAGTTFTVLLPVTKSEAAQRRDPDECVTVEPSGGCILIIDDEVAVQSVASRILRRAGYEVLTAGDGFEGLQIVQSQGDRIDLVLLDLNMPSLTGEETYQRIQAISPGKKVLIMSGYSEQEASHLLGGLGFQGFLQKPFLPEVLTRKIQEALSSSNGKAPPPPMPSETNESSFGSSKNSPPPLSQVDGSEPSVPSGRPDPLA